MNKILEKILSVPKSFYVSYRLTSLKNAFRLPVFVRYNCKIISLKGKLDVNENLHYGILTVGFEQVGIFDKRFERSVLQIDGIVEIAEGAVNIGQGGRICVMSGGRLKFDGDFINTASIEIICNKEISFGRGVLTSWNILVMDTDFHPVRNIVNGNVSCPDGRIHICDYVWIGARSIILKGAIIPQGCIVGAGSCCNKKFTEENCLLAGSPAVIKKHGVTRGDKN